MFEQRPLIELERECNHARLRNLIEELIYCPVSARPYIFMRFSKNTSKLKMEKVFKYVRENYDVDDIDLCVADKSIYIEYDFWKRFPSD